MATGLITTQPHANGHVVFNVGRPSKLTPERQQVIVEAIRKGVPAETSARATGISGTTFYNWMSKGPRTEGREISL